jgi:S1-C subfamily serine protease
VIGFPLANTLGEQPSIVSGDVSAMTGIDDSPTQFRMTALINSGNSGGPILREVVGIVVGSLVGRAVEGVNFGIKISTTLPLLHQTGLKVDDWKQDRPMTASEIFDTFSKYVVLVKVNGN